MGMAASQARFLSLTARKTNVEYEGQQINQQRTSLANQSAAYYNNLLTMNVPTPPDPNNYTKITYSWVQAGETATISNMFYQSASGTYVVNYDQEETIQGVEKTSTKNSVFTKTVEGKTVYYVGGDDAKYEAKPVPSDQRDQFYQTESSEPDATTPDGKLNPDAFYAVEYATGKYRYYLINDVQQDKGNGVQQWIPTTITQKQTHSLANCHVSFVNGSASSITLPAHGIADDGTVYYLTKGQYVDGNCNECADPSTLTKFSEQSFFLSANTVKDEEAYDQAMNEYSYENYLYEQEQTKINAQIEIIQAQDKDLELRLKQLDTEENAIKTEMDAVQAVLKDNVEKTFKTFNA